MTDVPPASRNALCPCGSGRRYKHCHGAISAPITTPTPSEGGAQPDAEALFRLGNARRDRGDLKGALEHYLRALPSAPGNAALLNNIGLVHGALGDTDLATDFFARALAVAPNHPAALANLAQNYYQRRRDAEAVALFDQLIAAQPVTVAAIWANRGVCLARMGDSAAAAESFERALSLEPDRLGVRLDAGNAYLKLEAFEAALRHFDAAHRLDPHCRFADSSAVALMQYLVRWDDFATRREHLLEVAQRIDREPDEYLSPLGILSLTDDPALQLQAARSATRHAVPQRPPAASIAARRGSARLRLGFVSSDFRNHPVGRLVVGLLERLDRAQFEVFVYAVGPEWSDAIATRVAEAPDHFVHVGWGYRDALGRCVRDDAIDVLFDLNGYTGLQMLEALSRRPAPMQVNFLGYTGTLGCSAYDYILADSYCIPPAAERWYEERVLRVDPCYLPSDPARELAAVPLRRADYGLPDDALVLVLLRAGLQDRAGFSGWLAIDPERPSRCGALVAARRGGRGRASSRRSACARHRGSGSSCSLHTRGRRATSPDSGLPISLSTRSRSAPTRPSTTRSSPGYRCSPLRDAASQRALRRARCARQACRISSPRASPTIS